MEPRASRPHAEPGPSVPIKLALRIGIPAIVVFGVVLLISGSHETRTVSEVIDEIHKIALAKPDGGLLGSWWVTAQSYDPQTSRLSEFKIECEPIHIAARSARVVVNQSTDSFHFEMWDVVVARSGEEGDDAEHNLLAVDRYVLGPIPYRTDIVADQGTRPPTPMSLVLEEE